METYLCTVVLCVLSSSGLVVGLAYQIPAVSFTASYNSVCPPDTHQNAVETDQSNKISDVLATKFPCGSTAWMEVNCLSEHDRPEPGLPLAVETV